MAEVNATAPPDIDNSNWPLHDLRSSFYMLHPSETYHETIAEVPPYLLIMFYPWGVLLILLEIILLQMKGKKKEWRLHSAVVSYSSIAMFEGFHIFFLRDLELRLYQWIFANLRLVTLPWNSLTTFLITLAGMEFGAYWWHRLCHEIAVMWATHEYHHSSDDFNLAIAFRNSATIRIFRWIFYVPLAFLGVPTSIMLTHLVLGSIFNGIIHMNSLPKFKKIIPGLGHVIDFIFVTPSHHRVHHASNPYCIDKNYGQYTILWDRFFGTFQEEKEDEPLVYGTLTQLRSYNIGYLQFYAYVKLWDKFKCMETLEHKFKALFYGPGWFPGTARLGNPDDIPDVRDRKKYEPTYPFFISCYLVVNSLCLFYSYVNMMHRVEHLPNSVLFVNLLYIYISYAAIGGIYDKQNYASSLELARIVGFLALSSFIPMLSSTLLSSIVYYILYIDIAMWPFVAKFVSSDYKIDRQCNEVLSGEKKKL